MLDRRPADVPRTFHHFVPWTSRNWVPKTSLGRPRLELLNICSSCKNRNRYVIQALLLLNNNFFIKSSTFVLVPRESPEGPLQVPDIRTFRGSSGHVPGKFCAGWVSNNC